MQNPLGWVVSSKQIVQEMNLRVNKRRLDEEVTNMVSLRLCNPFGGSRPVNIADFPRVSRKAPGLAKLSFPLARASEQPACQSVTAETRKSRALPRRARISFLLQISISARQVPVTAREGGNQPPWAGRPRGAVATRPGSGPLPRPSKLGPGSPRRKEPWGRAPSLPPPANANTPTCLLRRRHFQKLPGSRSHGHGRLV